MDSSEGDYFGAAIICGEVVSKKFIWAHKTIRGVLCAFLMALVGRKILNARHYWFVHICLQSRGTILSMEKCHPFMGMTCVS